MSTPPPGESLGARYGDPRLDLRARHLAGGGAVTEVFRVKEEGDTISIRCQVCEMTVYGLRNLNQHIANKKHQAKFSSKTWELLEATTTSSSPQLSLSLPEPVSAIASVERTKAPAVTAVAAASCAVAVDPTKLFPADQESVVMRQLDNAKEAVIGLEYLLEIREDGYRSNPVVICLLCNKEFQASTIMGHIYSATHRLTYLECFFPIARRKFAKVPNLGVWERSTFNHLDSVVTRIEARLGRMKPWVVLGRHFLNIEMEGVRKVVETGSHFKEAVGLNFRTIPDPFELYIKNLPGKEIVTIEPQSPHDPKGRPGIDLRVPYSGTREVVDLEKDSVMNRIAHLRKEIKHDNKVMDIKKMYRDEVQQKKQNRPEKTAASTSSDTHEELEIVSDDDMPGENKDLKTRKPEKRGIRSRNPGGLDSRKERDSKIPDRVLYMDREAGREERDKEVSRSRARGEDKADRRDRRRSRSRSRSRDRGGGGGSRKERSVSPYVVAMESWNKFKKAEKAMLGNIAKRREMYEKRPEDHPKYAAEWKHFWEKRYKELQSQGRDPGNHDFKAEWIPYWTKHVANLFDTEVLDKTNDLMKKFNLTSVAEPKREDFKQVQRRRSRSREKRSRSRERDRGSERRRSPARRKSPDRRRRSKSPIRKSRRSRSRSVERRDDRGSRDQLADPRGSRPDVWEDQARRAEPGPGPWLESSSRRAGGSRWSDDQQQQQPALDWQQQQSLAHTLDRLGQAAAPGHTNLPFGGNFSEDGRNRPPPFENNFGRGEVPFRNKDGQGSDGNMVRNTNVFGSNRKNEEIFGGMKRPEDSFGGNEEAITFGKIMEPFNRNEERAPVQFGRNPSSLPFGQFGRKSDDPGPLFPAARVPEEVRAAAARHESNDVYSGLSELEDRRDRGRSRTPSKLEKVEAEAGPVQVVHCLRLLSALEDSLGSLGPVVNQILGKALSIEQTREGASSVLLEDPDTVSILDMVKEKLSGQMVAGLLEGSRQGAVRVCLTSLNRLLNIATKKRSDDISSLITVNRGQMKTGTRTQQEEEAEEMEAQTLIAETLASCLVQAGQDHVTDEELETIVAELLRMTAKEDPGSSLGRYATSFLQAAAMEKQSQGQFNSYKTQKQPEIKKEVQIVTIDDGVKDASEPLSELTIEDLQSLLNSFNTLSKQEQTDLINYMKKLEATNPEKVKKLKEGMSNFKPEVDEGPNLKKKKSDWSPPPFSKRSRRLSGSDLEMNPVNPEPEQSSSGPASGQPREDGDKWKPLDSSSFEEARFSQQTNFRDNPRMAAFGQPPVWQGGQQPGARGDEFSRGRPRDDEMDQIPLNQMYTSRGDFGRNFAANQEASGPFNPMFQSQRFQNQNNPNQRFDNW